MRIGICLSSVPAYSETFLISKIKGLKKAGHDVKIFILGRSAVDARFDYIRPYPFEKILLPFWFPVALIRVAVTKPHYLIRFLWSDLKWRKATEVAQNFYFNAHILPYSLDWIHFEFANLAVGRENLASAMGAKMSLSLRGYDVAIFPLNNPGCYDKVWTMVNKVHTISDDLHRVATRLGLQAGKPYRKIMPAISTIELRRRRIYSTWSGKIRILTTGRLEWKKGYPYALRAMKLLKEKGINFEYHILGDGNQREELQFLIHDMGLSDCVRLMGKVRHSIILSSLAETDIYLQPSIQEGFCNSLLEAQGSGLLCIATDAEGLTENVVHGQTGWTVKRRDAQGIADQVLRILEMPANEMQEVATRAMERVKKDFAIERLEREFDEFYKN